MFGQSAKQEKQEQVQANRLFTLHIVIGMLVGVGVGLLIKWLPFTESVRHVLVNDILDTGGKIFLNLIKMMVVPIVLVSLVCGSRAIGSLQKFRRIGLKAIALYLVTTAVAVTIAILIANVFQIGHGMALQQTAQEFKPTALSIKDIILNIFPINPFQSLAEGQMLPIILFALLFGMALALIGETGKKLGDVFDAANAALMKLILIIMKLAPYGVFCLLAELFAKIGFRLIGHLAGYFIVVLLVLAIQLFVTYSVLLKSIGRLSMLTFLRKMRATMLFAFSISSSNASIPVVLRTTEKRLGVDNSVASFIIPLGSTINMDGTAIMQGVATVFIAHAYHIGIGVMGYVTVVVMATLASIGTAGVPSVGLITLAMVLQQVGLPVQGIALIIGVDRLLDMARTAVNVSGDAMIACLVSKTENSMDLKTYNARD